MDYVNLGPVVLTLAANRFHNDFLLEEEAEKFNKAMRFAACRQCTLWQCGFMGANMRKPVPS